MFYKSKVFLMVILFMLAMILVGCNLTTPGTDGEFSAVVKIIDAPESMWGQDINWWQTKEVDRQGDPIPFSLITKVDPPVCGSPHHVYITVDPAGTGDVTGAGNYREGTWVYITATAHTGYKFVNWTTSDVTIISPTFSSITFRMPCKDVEITAHFEERCTQHELKLQAAPGAGGTVSTGGDYCKDTVVPISATASSGYMFTHWTPGTDLVDEFLASTSIKMPEHDVELTAHFKKADCPECPECDSCCEECPTCPECIECLQNCDCDVDIDVEVPVDIDVEVPVDCGDVDVNVVLPIWNSEFDRYVYVYFNIENTGADIQEYTVTFTAYGVVPGTGTPIKSTDYITFTGSATGKDLAAGEDRDSFAQIDVSNSKVVWVELANLDLK